VLKKPRKKQEKTRDEQQIEREGRAKNFGKKLQQFRIDKTYLTQEDLAYAAHVSVDHIRGIERGVRIPSIGIADDLRRAVGAEWKDLLPPSTRFRIPSPA